MLIMTVFIVMGIGYYLTTSYGVEGIYGAAVAISAFFLVTPLQNGAMPLDRLGAKGMFVGILVAVAAGSYIEKLF